MAILTVRKIPEDVHRALKVKAAHNGRSTEAEVREILSFAVKPRERVLLGDALANLGRKIGLTDAELETITKARKQIPAQPITFG